MDYTTKQKGFRRLPSLVLVNTSTRLSIYVYICLPYIFPWIEGFFNERSPLLCPRTVQQSFKCKSKVSDSNFYTFFRADRFHTANENLIKKNRSYFLKYQPIGCRDTSTRDLFKKYDIKALCNLAPLPI